MLYNSKILKALYTKFFFGIITLFFLLFNIRNTCNAGIYTTNSNGNWNTPAIWNNYLIAPENINYQDLVLINNIVNAQDLKINNGGTLIINKQLDAESITFNGPDSRLIVEEGAVLNVQHLQGNTNNIIYKQNNTPLPVKLVFFGLNNSDKTRKTNHLIWQTAQEKDNDYFQIERSFDGKSFESIGKVEGSNYSSGATYFFEDLQPRAKTYYRLKQLDFDGNYSYSPVILAETNLKFQLNTNELIFGSAFSGQVRILNLTGQQISAAVLKQSFSYSIPSNLRGIFVLQIESEGIVINQRILL